MPDFQPAVSFEIGSGTLTPCPSTQADWWVVCHNRLWFATNPAKIVFHTKWDCGCGKRCGDPEYRIDVVTIQKPRVRSSHRICILGPMNATPYQPVPLSFERLEEEEMNARGHALLDRFVRRRSVRDFAPDPVPREHRTVRRQPAAVALRGGVGPGRQGRDPSRCRG